MKRQERIEKFCTAIWQWYAENKRILPWRDLGIADDTQHAYQIFVSEIMLQQTQVPRVITAYPAFLKRFPTLQSIAQASDRDILVAWKGMGYNRRALAMRNAARTIIADFNGVFPQEMKDLVSIKGIGNYTAAAIRNFAFNLPTPCIDVNIERIYSRVFYGSKESPTTKDMTALSEEVLQYAIDEKSGHDAREWHAALMDFGSLICTKRNPKYDICPLMQHNLYKDPYKEIGTQKKKKPEPNRNGIPNRIYRGKVVDALRTHKQGLASSIIGKTICSDWNSEHDKEWLQTLLKGLVRDKLIATADQRFILAD